MGLARLKSVPEFLPDGVTMTKQTRKLRKCIECGSKEGVLVRFHPITKHSLGVLCRKHAPKTVKRSELSSIKMVAGNEKKFNKVIADGQLKEWIGFGWIDIRKPTAADEQHYPFAVT